MDKIADYRRECEAFQALVADDCRKRFLFFHGESGCGKTTLVNHCRTLIPRQTAYIPIQLRGKVVGVAEIFSRAGNRLSWERLGAFTEQVASLQSAQNAQQVRIDRNWLVGINQHIRVVLNVEDQNDRHSRNVSLTDAWFQDLGDLNNLVLIVFDTYEEATSEVKDWISGPFLSRAERMAKIRVLISGQEVPDKNNIEWQHCCEERKLLGVPEARHWWPLVEELDRRIPFDRPLDWLAGVCHALKGQPKDIIQIIEGLPRRTGGR